MTALRHRGALVRGQDKPGPGKLHDLDRPSEPIRQQRPQPLGGARPGSEKSGIVKQRLGADGEPGHQMRRREPGERQQRLGHPIVIRTAGPGGGFGRARQAIFDRGPGEHRDHALRQQIQELVQGMRAVPQRTGQRLGIEPRQHAGRPGQPDRRGGEFGGAAVARRRHLPHLGSRVGQPGSRAEARRVGRVGGFRLAGEDPHRGVETKAPRLGQQAGVGRIRLGWSRGRN